jgi:hypothetical protein
MSCALGANLGSTTAVRSAKDRRQIFIWDLWRSWIVATEHDERGYNDPVFAF